MLEAITLISYVISNVIFWCFVVAHIAIVMCVVLDMIVLYMKNIRKRRGY